jgi:fructosamine-3-kinase
MAHGAAFKEGARRGADPGMTHWTEIADHISSTLGVAVSALAPEPVGGGCINQAYRIGNAGQRFFVKLNSADRSAMFAAEAEGLLELRKADAVRAPEPICWGVAGADAYLVLELFELRPLTGHGQALLGAQLAALHRHIGAQFGWYRDNTIGSTPQINAPTQGWVSFWREHRLQFQCRLAKENGYAGRLTEKLETLIDELPALLSDHSVQPSLLHGDLWGGNVAADAKGQPVVFDPAVYYGDRETDIAMTELFGGFSAEFYHAYKAEYPLAAGYRVRRTLYNLYHVLNHLNLFGGGYRSQAEHMTDELLGEIR